MAFMSNPAAGGSFTPYVKYNAKAGRWYTKEDEPDAEEFEVTDMTAVFDMDNLQTGWFLFNPGVAPEKTMDPSLAEAAPQPSDKHKRGFQLNAFSEKNLHGMREFSSTAGTVIGAMNTLHDQWEAGKAANPGKLPVVKCTGVVGETNKHGTNYRPTLEVVAWADKPAEMAGTAAATQSAEPEKKAAADHAPPPAKQDADVDF